MCMYVLVVVPQNVEKHEQMSKSWVKIKEKQRQLRHAE